MSDITSELVFNMVTSTGVTPDVSYIKDSSRYKNDGTNTDVTYTKLPSGLWVAGFNGSTSKSVIGTPNSLTGFRQITICQWIKLNAVGSTQSLQRKHQPGTWDYFTFVLGSGKPGFSIYGQVPVGTIYSTPVLKTGYWYHILGTWTAGSTAFIQYVNGIAYPDVFSAVPTVSKNTATAIIGQHATVAGSEVLNGYIAKAKIYVRAFTAAQVRRLYTSEKKWFV